MNIKTVRNLNNLEGKRVVLRVDFNVSIKENHVIEDFRIRNTLPTIDFLIKAGAKLVIISHLDEKEGETLEPVARYLCQFFPKIRFLQDIFAEESINEVNQMKSGDMILFENIRNWPGEKNNDENFAKHLASFGHFFVNDAFSVSHRKHASIVGVPRFLPSVFGLSFEKELKNLSKVFDAPKPFLLILGGAKFETKLPIINKFLDKADNIFVGGALANSLFKAKGLFVGDSLVSEGFNFEKYINSKKLILPSDVRTQYKGFFYTKKPNEISVNEKIWDIGPQTTKDLEGVIKNAKFILWNGPMGNYEQGFINGTKELADSVSENANNVVVGGGDIVSCLNSFGMMDKFSFVSTAGGAMLDFLVNETLPGIEAINVGKDNDTKSWIRKIFS